MKSGGSRSRAALSVGEGTLSGQVALVTGEARGLGKELVRALAAAGASLAVLSRNQADCDSVIIELAENGTAAVGVEADVTDRAQPVARYADGPLAGRPVVTRHEVGRGAAWYVGTLLDPGTMHSLFGRVCRDAGTGPVVDLGAGSAVEAVRRRGEQGMFLFVINHGGGPIRVPTSGEDLVTGNRVEWLFPAVSRCPRHHPGR